MIAEARVTRRCNAKRPTADVSVNDEDAVVVATVLRRVPSTLHLAQSAVDGARSVRAVVAARALAPRGRHHACVAETLKHQCRKTLNTSVETP